MLTSDINGTVVLPNTPESFYTVRATVRPCMHASKLVVASLSWSIETRPCGGIANSELAARQKHTNTVVPFAPSRVIHLERHACYNPRDVCLNCNRCSLPMPDLCGFCRYKFDLQATFVTQIPMPVITIEPMVVNLDNLELEALALNGTSYTYTVTNYGLIRADGFDLTLPTSHPFLTFHYDAPIGDIAANSSVTIPVTVSIKPGSRRRRSSGCHVGAAAYSVECGGTRYSYIGLTFSGGSPCTSGGRALPFKVSIRPIHGSFGGSSSPSTGSYNPVAYKTIDFCDPCTKAFVSCSWHSDLRVAVSLTCFAFLD